MNRSTSGFETMRNLLKPREATPAIEVCEMCSAAIPDAHSHIADLENRSFVCACRACYLLFTSPEAGKGRYRSVPERCLAVPGFQVQKWESFGIPVNMAFIFRNSKLDGGVAVYPSPGGPVESYVSPAAWQDAEHAHGELHEMEADIEAALFRVKDSEVECFVVPLDRCYELVGELRLVWRGFEGGEEAHARIDEFFESVRANARPR